jgi:putative sigma-54 modulation protein
MPPIGRMLVQAGMAIPNPMPDDLTKIHLTGVHVDLTPAMQAVMREKFSVLLRHSDTIVRVNVTLRRDQTRGTQHFYSCTGQIEIRGPDVVATAKGDDAYNVIDALVQKLDEQLRDRHERRKDKRNHPRDVEIAASLPKMPST